MNTFPYDSWEEALEAADGASGYFTFGPGGNLAMVILTILAIALAVAWMGWLTMNETKHLNESADKVAQKWGL